MWGILLFFLPSRIHTHVIVLSVGELQFAGFLIELKVGMTGRLRAAQLLPFWLWALSGCSSGVCVQSLQANQLQPVLPKLGYPCWEVLTAPSNREFVERLVLLKRQQDKSLKGALSLCRVHMSSPSLSLSDLAPVATRQTGETAGGMFPFLIKTCSSAAVCFFPLPLVCQPDWLSWWKTTQELCLWAPGAPHSICLYCFSTSCVSEHPKPGLWQRRGDEELDSDIINSEETRTVRGFVVWISLFLI